jgi:hypothetical protein
MVRRHATYAGGASASPSSAQIPPLASLPLPFPLRSARSFSSCTFLAISCAIFIIHACSKIPPELDELAASSAGGDDESAEILSNDKERRRGEVDCCAEWRELRDRVGRLWDDGREDLVGVSRAKSVTSVDAGGWGVRYWFLRWGMLFAIGAAGSKSFGL